MDIFCFGQGYKDPSWWSMWLSLFMYPHTCRTCTTGLWTPLSIGCQPDPSSSLCLALSLLQPDRDLDGALPPLPLPYRLWNRWGSGLSIWLPCSLSPLSVSSSAAPSAQLLVFSFPIYCNNFLSDVSGISSPTEWLTKPSTTSATSLVSPLSSLSASTPAVLN